MGFGGEVAELGYPRNHALEGHQEHYRNRYAEFQKEFCPHDDGAAATRVADLILERIGMNLTER